MPFALSSSLRKTQSLLENFSQDVKRARSSLLNSNRPIPQFPQSEWLNLLSSNAIDLDHVFSNLYTISHDDRESIELGRNVELLHGLSAPAKTVKLHGDWVIAWEALADSSSNIASKNSSCTANTSKGSSPPYHPNSTVGSSITTKLCASELLNDTTLSCRISRSSQTCKSNGSTIPSTSHLPSLQTPSLDNPVIANAVHLVEGGTNAGAPTQHPLAITCMYAPDAQMLAMQPMTVPTPTRSKTCPSSF